MKFVMMAAGLALGLAACETGEVDVDSNTGMAVDTVVTERTVQDTAIVTTDTTVDVDTSVSRGDGAVGGSDTLRDTRDQGGMTDRMAAPDTSVGAADTQRIQRQTNP